MKCILKNQSMGKEDCRNSPFFIHPIFKHFNDYLLSLKEGANFEGKTAPATEKRLKKQKNKTAESVERLISTHFCGFPLYQFRCCDVPMYLWVFS